MGRAKIHINPHQLIPVKCSLNTDLAACLGGVGMELQ